MKTKLILTILLALLLAGCATQSVNMAIMRPAEVNLYDYNTIAVGDIWGPPHQWFRAQDIRDAFTARLLESEYFETVLDRQYLQAILQEHYLSWSGFVNEESAPQLGKFIGAAALVVGRVTRDEYKEDINTETITKKDKNDVEYEVLKHTRTGTHYLSVNIQILDVQTSAVLANKRFDTSFSDSKSAEDRKPPRIDQSHLYGVCVDDLSHQFVRTVAPYYVNVSVTYELDKKYLPELQTAHQMVVVGETGRALEILQAAALKPDIPAKSRAKAYYNLGLIQTYSGDYENALTNLIRALELVPGNSRYSRAIRICRDERYQAEQVRQQMEGN
ncbi:MAG TPA: CsgG/HfaB family protein [Candidatus Syntrophosphaera sp.]|jgi:tetratricopeptide (TPR) repeat protein|nr:CsgG/HfaB family protein [Candidatus Cloacimonadota bacterium]HOR03149.1 CsgG/HfaB family protein [Candidatus Syntrophosphaera sp.]HPK82618.1 CsgG/HfaB family protein [Candidatus Syntrophosphaera sp.]HQG93909.1 CsgG/HfaB family protein [Candidatus Syntrophosphaera sp.]HQK28569.1 CsgG/HfaB family protein [Candidatus Syntrophosphaera sp.]